MFHLEPITAERTLDLIFRDTADNALIGFGSRRPFRSTKGKKTKPPGSRYWNPCRKQDLKEYLPLVLQKAHEANQTAYYCPNTYSNHALAGNKQYEKYLANINNGSPTYFEAMNKHIFSLCSIVLDCDINHPKSHFNGTPHQALEKVYDLVKNNRLPTPSLCGFSGRGFYLLWLLRDRKSGLPLSNNDENRAKRKVCVDELVEILQIVDADSNALRLCNWYKLPDTIDTNTGKTVEYFVTHLTGEEQSKPKAYTLDDLMKFLNVKVKVKEKKTGHRKKKSKKKESKSVIPLKKSTPGRGGMPWLKVVREIEKICKFRGGIPEGQRELFLYHYYHSSKAVLKTFFPGEDKDDVREAVTRAAKLEMRILNKRWMDPPLTDEELKSPTEGSIHRPRGSTIAQKLGVTTEEAQILNLTSIAPESLKKKIEKAKRHKRELREFKRDLVDEALLDGWRNLEIVGLYYQYGVRKSYVSERKKIISRRNQ